jgi:hypothetical protein
MKLAEFPKKFRYGRGGMVDSLPYFIHKATKITGYITGRYNKKLSGMYARGVLKQEFGRLP